MVDKEPSYYSILHNELQSKHKLQVTATKRHIKPSENPGRPGFNYPQFYYVNLSDQKN
jgi:hypothetical protein